MISITLLVLVATTFTQNILIFAYLLLTAVLLAGQPPLRFAFRLVPLTIVATWLLVIMSIFYTQGETAWFDVGPVTITREGAAYGGALFFRIFSLGTASLIFGLTTEPQRMVAELVEFGKVPYRLAYAFYTGLRFMPLLQSEAENVINAHAVRGAAEKERSLLARLVPIRRLAVPLLASGLRRVQITAIAMDSRGFGAYPKRTNILDLVQPRSAVIYAALHVLVFLALFVWQVILGHGGSLAAPIG